MKKLLIGAFIWLIFSISIYAQQVTVSGKLADAFTNVPLPLVKVSIEGLNLETYSNSDGFFSLELDVIEEKESILLFSKPGYLIKRFPVNTQGIKFLETILLQPDPAAENFQQNTISLSEAELLGEDGEFDNISGILQSTRDVYLNAAAFDFGQTFFRVRGLGSEYGKVLINGLEMNKVYDGRPQWNNWGGLNDAQRNQIFNLGISANPYQFGGLGGTTNIIMRASKYQQGAKFVLSGANRSYTGRAMVTYASGEQKKGWFYALSIGRRVAEEGFIEGTVYEANSFFLTIEKRIDEKHSLNFSGIYTPNIRGRSAALTQEVFDLKGRTYNPFWGLQNGEIRNSRIREIKEPILMLNHFWKLSEKIELNTNLAYQFGETANSRIDYGGTTLSSLGSQNAYLGGGANPDPAYYQKLPSYFLRFEENKNFEAAFRAQQNFEQNGQVNWESLYLANKNALESGQNTVYALAEEVNRDTQISANSLLSLSFSQHLKADASFRFSQLKSQNFARIKDLLGGNTFLDIDVFAEDDSGSTLGASAQSDLQNPNRLADEGENYKYNYDLSAQTAEAFFQVNWNSRKTELTAAGKLGSTQYSRFGHFQNGLYPQNSLGESDILNFTDYGLKIGGLYKISNRQNLELNLGYFTKSPGLRNSYDNPRQNNEAVRNIQSEKIEALDFNYRYRSGKFNLRLTGYFNQIKDITEVSFYYTDGLAGLGRADSRAFVQEVLTNMNKRYLGVELGTEYQVTPTIKLKAVAGLGEFVYANNPDLYLSSANFSGIQDYGKTFLKNYRIAGGPQRAAQLGFEYRDPDFWFFGTTLNYFSHAFIDINPLTRTANFRTDFDGFPLLDYEPELARELLKQEQFGDYFLLNAIGGKSWRIKDKYLGLFVSLNNILDKLYKSGGYEQARNANFRTLKEDTDRDLPLFGPKYWYGHGTTFFANISFRY